MATFKIAFVKRAKKIFLQLNPKTRRQIIQDIFKRLPDYNIHKTTSFKSVSTVFERKYLAVESYPYRILVRVDLHKQRIWVLDIDYDPVYFYPKSIKG